MSKKKIVYQGEPGANSDTAAREAYPDHTPMPCATFEDAFAAVSSKEAELAMIPVENSVAGRVADIHHLMPTSGLNIGGPDMQGLVRVPGSDGFVENER